MITNAEKKAKKKYNEKVKKILLEFYPKDKQIYEYIRTKKTMQGYIKGLIKKEMEG